MNVPRTAHDSILDEEQTPAAATIDACGLTCGCLEPLIARTLRPLAAGEVLEIESDRDEAADGIRAWLWLTGHTLLRVEKDQSSGRAKYFVRKNTRHR